MHGLVLGLTSGASCLCRTDAHYPELSLQLGFRWSTCPEDAFGIAWRSHCRNIFFFYQKWEVSGSFERLVCLVGPSLVIICAQLVIATQLLAEAACVLWAWLEAAVPLDSYQSNICSPVAAK